MQTEPLSRDEMRTTQKPRAVHVDTSLQIEQQKVPSQADPVRTALARYPFSSTSSYARKEFKKAWLQDLGLLYALAGQAKHIGELNVLVRKKTWARPRRVDRCFDAINTFFTKHPTAAGETAMIRLRAHVAEAILGSYIKWERSVTHEYDGTGCYRARERPKRSANGTMDVIVRKCTPSKVQCRVHQFFTANRVHFTRILDEIDAAGENASNELTRTAKTIRLAIANPTSLCDSDNCTAMGDALIAVDGVATDHFAANNDREWQILSKALGRPLINPVSDTKKSAPVVKPSV